MTFVDILYCVIVFCAVPCVFCIVILCKVHVVLYVSLFMLFVGLIIKNFHVFHEFLLTSGWLVLPSLAVGFSLASVARFYRSLRQRVRAWSVSTTHNRILFWKNYFICMSLVCAWISVAEYFSWFGWFSLFLSSYVEVKSQWRSVRAVAWTVNSSNWRNPISRLCFCKKIFASWGR